MNVLDAVRVMTPYNTEEDCAMFTIDDADNAFKIASTMISGHVYTFSCWARADADCQLTVCQIVPRDLETGIAAYVNALTADLTTEWQYITHTFVAETNSLDLLLNLGRFYIYHSQLELGHKATDWTPNPEDVDNDINGAREHATAEADRAAGDVRKDFIEFTDKFGRYIRFLSETAIAIGSDGSQIVLEIDNETGIVFKKNNTPIAWWDGNDFHTSNIYVEVNQRARFGDFAFIPRSDGSLSFLKVGG
mgnify:CR=1 FL=1